MSNQASIAASTNCTVSINRHSSNVSIRLESDEGEPIVDERVLLLHGDLCNADVYQATSDDQGEVRFTSLPIRPAQFVYIVLPDVLEAWDTKPVREIWESEGDALDAPEDRGPEVLATTATDARDSSVDNIRSFQNFDKDALDKLEKVQVHPTGSNAVPLGAVDLRKLNRKYKQRANYRRLDFTKYATSTTTSTDVFKMIRINRLTEEEKYNHHLDAYTLNNAGYTGASAAKNKYDKDERVWRLNDGAVCNGFINYFLGYWYNLNAAFTVQCKNEKFILMMEKSGDMSSQRRYRGFSDVVDAALPIPAAVQSRRFKGYSWTAIDDAAPNPLVPHLRLADPSASDPQASPGYRFTYSNAADPTADPNSVTDGLSTYNVYSKSSDKRRNGNVIMDHHGGLMIRSEDGVIETLAADGNKSGGVYSLTPIVQKSPAGLMSSSSVHLRIWPLQTLRAGGYAPDGGTPAVYKAEAEFGGEDDLDPAFRRSLSRFILWG